MSEKTLAENLIQIWARKKYADTHVDGDTYYIEIGYEEDYSGCETCGGTTYGIIEISKRNKKGPYRIVESLKDVNFHDLLNEMLFPAEVLKNDS